MRQNDLFETYFIKCAERLFDGLTIRGSALEKKEMSKIPKFIIFILAIAIGFFTYKWTFESVWLTTSSPHKTYTVEFTGDKGRGGFIIPSFVGYKVIKAGNIIARNSSVHSGDWMDISFELAYPQHDWIDENVLRFWGDSNLPEQRNKFDTLLISNETDRAISHLEVKAKDLFLIFDIPPHTTMKLSSSHQTEGTGFWTQGAFDDGKAFSNGASFCAAESNEPLQYRLSVNQAGIRISRLQEDGSNKESDFSCD